MAAKEAVGSQGWRLCNERGGGFKGIISVNRFYILK
jgi:hypothetical protein